MKSRRSMLMVLLLGVAAVVLPVAAKSDQFDMIWHAITGGGGTSNGGNLTLSGAISPWGIEYMTGGSYMMRADYLGPRANNPPTPEGIRIYLPGVLGD